MANLVSLGRRNVLFDTKQTNKKCDYVNLPAHKRTWRLDLKNWHRGKFHFHRDPSSNACVGGTNQNNFQNESLCSGDGFA